LSEFFLTPAPKTEFDIGILSSRTAQFCTAKIVRDHISRQTKSFRYVQMVDSSVHYQYQTYVTYLGASFLFTRKYMLLVRKHPQTGDKIIA
jgi:hypothetical protein